MRMRRFEPFSSGSDSITVPPGVDEKTATRGVLILHTVAVPAFML